MLFPWLLFVSLFCLHPGSMFADVCLQDREVVSSAQIYNGRGRWSSPCTLSFSSAHLKTLAGRRVGRSAGCLCELQARLRLLSKAYYHKEQDSSSSNSLLIPRSGQNGEIDVFLFEITEQPCCLHWVWLSCINRHKQWWHQSRHALYEPVRDTVFLWFLLLL